MRLNWITLKAARHTFNNFFARKYGRKPIGRARWILLLLKSSLVEIAPADFLAIKNTKAGPSFFCLTVEEAYPLNERNRGDDDITSLINFLRLIDARKKLPRIIIGEIDGELVMLDGDHRAIAASIRGVSLPARIVRIP